MHQKIRTAYRNLFIGINECKSETMLHHYDVLRGLFIDNYQPRINSFEITEWTATVNKLTAALINKRELLAIEIEDHIETAMILEAIDEGMIAHQFNDCK